MGIGLCDVLFRYVGHKIIIGKLFFSFSSVTCLSLSALSEILTPEFIIEVQFQDMQLTKRLECVCVCVCVCGGGD